ncbi:uncharacterized protein B0I36DRAFT_367780 [Microdochium trichocladiopsis]|uniref:Zn(2)-C6 fungal-type domain-containing protein n=1 Tax=Microdochium trichocladiopsis TaxID=1682393 RepID=A0A9P8XWC8_9PEZI|nr:uncharacterized protein B0I36DRAFT_367780 [Microdochium trichocladiopsis]KAH7021364.1 hypothetical protein B0I36DRAFT_367780 [Microdochium trichocladiopsis]
MTPQVAVRPALSPCPQGGKVKNKRASAPKVKTGCRSCKASHIKCDEQKPTCGRCDRREIACIYPLLYSRRDGIAVGSQRPLQAILPAQHNIQLVRYREPSVTCLTPREAQYYDNFRHRVICHLAHGESDFWHRTVLRESIHDECVRSAVIALGALARAQEHHVSHNTPREVSRLPLQKIRLETIENRSLGPNHYYHALSHYTDALGIFRRRLTSPEKHTPRAILIATTLLASFEFLQGNTSSLDQLAAYTLSLLSGKLMQGIFGTRTLSDSAIAAQTDDDGVREAEAVLVRICLFNAAFSPLYPKIRQAVSQLPVPSFSEPHPPDLGTPCDVFARLSLEYLTLVSVWHFRVLTGVRMDPGKSHSVHYDHDAIHALATPEVWWTRHFEEQAEIMLLLEEWRAAFTQRLALQPLTDSDRQTCNRILSAINTCLYTVSTVFDFSTGTWDFNEAATGELLAQTEAVCASFAACSEGNFDAIRMTSGRFQPPHGAPAGLQDQSRIAGGSIYVVATIAQDCRHRTLRRRALDLFTLMVTTSSHWEIRAHYLGIKALFEAEEENRDPVTGMIPLDGQWDWVGGSWSDDYSEFYVVLVSKVGVLDGTGRQKIVTMQAISS